MNNTKKAEIVLRIAVAGEFIGHGVFALQVKEAWIPYFHSVGFSTEVATTLLPIIGIMDIALAVLVLIRVIPILVAWMVFWGFLTALIRPIAGQPIFDFIERWANWGAPLALLYLHGVPKSFKEWFK